MVIILQFVWPLIVTLVAGVILGVLFTLVFGQKKGVLRKPSLTGMIIGSIICGIVLTYSIIEYGNQLSKALFQCKVRIAHDIDLQRDYFFDKESGIKGIIKEGSLATQTFSKGQAVYLTFSTAVDRSHVEIIKEK